jgi:hypothetical protein
MTINSIAVATVVSALIPSGASNPTIRGVMTAAMALFVL